MKVLLGVDSIQPLIVTALIERIPDFIDEDGGKYVLWKLSIDPFKEG